MTALPLVLQIVEGEEGAISAETLPLQFLRPLLSPLAPYLQWKFDPFEQMWRVRATHWVGVLPLGDLLQIVVTPRLSAEHLAQWWGYLYQWSPRWRQESADLATIDGLWQEMVHQLLLEWERVVARGIVYEYQPLVNSLTTVRGRVLGPPQGGTVICDYAEFSADHPLHHALLLALQRASQAGVISPRDQGHWQRAFLLLRGHCPSLPPHLDWDALLFHRQNAHYRPSLALARTLYESLTPIGLLGRQTTPTFLFNTHRFFEQILHHWLDLHLPPTLHLLAQRRVEISANHPLHYKIDFVLEERGSQKTVAVLDAKYKREDRPGIDDFQQIVSYALSLGCRHAFLLYPHPLPNPFWAEIGGVRVEAVPFELDRPIEKVGETLKEKLISLTTSH